MHERHDWFRSNLDNLTALWRALGAGSVPMASGARLSLSRSWPHRLWYDVDRDDTGEERLRLTAVAAAAPRELTLPRWRRAPAAGPEPEFVAAGFELAFRQTVMGARLDQLRRDAIVVPALDQADGAADVESWCDVAARSFGYTIDPAAVARLVGRDDASLLLARRDGVAVGTGLLFVTGDVAGLHMVGVPPEARRGGVAGAIMLRLCDEAARRGLSRVTLQASAMGEGLYQKLGFAAHGHIDNLRRVAS
ncbi:MAG: GNAT family N-acetyltransferase [Planctomycetes bacterium]|nr:GNAT family N-acetyltransferase [Planctomycetota bacterium]